MPHRILRKRTKGWRMPEGAVYVGRPSIFGNPFDSGAREFIMREYRIWMGGKTVNRWPWLTEQREKVLSKLHELRGKDLVCWCKPGQECHADVLLQMANDPESTVEFVLDCVHCKGDHFVNFMKMEKSELGFTHYGFCHDTGERVLMKEE